MSSEQAWYEVWADEGLDPPYVLIMKFSPEERLFYIYDPREGDKVIFGSSSYEGAKNWLLEDEYVLVNGRMEI